jgi:photosystem II stability/assembly factor-like uncharacterized protein
MTVLVGTAGQGIMRSPDGGETWQRIAVNQGMYQNPMVRALANHPMKPEVVFAGTERGLFKSEDAGQDWRHIDSPLSDYSVWAIAIDPSDPDVVFAGTGTPTPVAMFRSSDAGYSWERRTMEVVEECPIGNPQMTGIAIDPIDPNNIWVGIEVDGLRHSSDGGDTWTKVGSDIPNLDVHNVAVSAGPPKTVVVVVNNDVYTSVDDGSTWKRLGIKELFPYTYPRGIMVHPGDPSTIFLTIGDTTPGRIGTVMRSKDTGQTWEDLSLPAPPNSAMWVVNVSPFTPHVAFAGSRYGHLYRSDNGGDSWNKLWREFSEISSVLSISN